MLAAKLMPIVLDTHPLNNPWLSYAVYLANFLLPAFLCMFVMFTTVYSISEEIKRRTSRGWLEAGNGSIIVALMGKLVPQALIFTAMGMLALSMLYGYAHFPLNSGFFPMFLAMVLMISSLSVFCPVCYRDNSSEQDCVECLCFVGRVVIFDMRFYLSGAFYAGVGSDRVESVPDASLFFDIRGSGFEWYSDDIFLAELRCIDGISIFADFYFAKVEVGCCWSKC